MLLNENSSRQVSKDHSAMQGHSLISLSHYRKTGKGAQAKQPSGCMPCMGGATESGQSFLPHALGNNNGSTVSPQEALLTKPLRLNSTMKSRNDSKRLSIMTHEGFC